MLASLTFRDYPTFRQWVQVVAAAVLYALVNYNVLPGATVDEWLALIAAVLPLSLSILNSASGLRTFVYGVLLAGQALLIVLNITDVAHTDPIINLILAAIGAGTAVTHTPTPLAASRGRHALPE
jgi:hypothetical protein